MIKNQFIQLIKQSKSQLLLNSEHLNDLDMLLNEYPFFQSAHLLYTKGLHATDAINYSKQLRKSAIVANSRAVLYELIHQKEIIAPTPTEIVNTEIKTPIVNVVEEPNIDNKQIETEVKRDTNTSPITITNNDIKVIYVNTVSSNPVVKVAEQEVVKELIPNKELDILKDVENETTETANEQDSSVEAKKFDEEKLNNQIETEISRGIIQSYVETDIIKTPELHKEKINEPLTFTSWLEKVKKESGTIQKIEPKIEKKEATQSSDQDSNSEQKQKKQLIDKIIESDPGRIKFGTHKFFTPQIDAKQSLLENEHLVTETLAKIYALQGNNAKAIRAYEILSLKFPQKSVYFASLIEKLKTNK